MYNATAAVSEEGAITREYAEEVTRQRLDAAGLGLITRHRVEYVLVPFSQFVDSTLATMQIAHAADVALAEELARPPRAVRRAARRHR